jgi:replication factor C subunit 2/4
LNLLEGVFGAAKYGQLGIQIFDFDEQILSHKNLGCASSDHHALDSSALASAKLRLCPASAPSDANALVRIGLPWSSLARLKPCRTLWQLATLTGALTPKAMTTPWVEKYRPKTVEDVCHQEEAIATLKNALETGNLPHLLFYGPPGTGKTSAVSAMVRQMFGPVVKERVLELNASDERGIDVVREKIKVFAKLAVGGLPPGFTCPPLKIIVLDEADCMTSDAQSALRRTMEQHSRVTRFCIMCNYVSRIIDPITSRCAKFRFSPLPATAMTSRLQHIAEQERVIFSDGALDALMLASAGDMRRAVSLMQNAASLDCNRVNTETIFSCAAVVPQPMVDALFQVGSSLAPLPPRWFCRTSSQMSFLHFQASMHGIVDAMQRQLDAVLREGYSPSQIISQLLSSVLAAGGGSLSEVQRGKLLIQLSEVDRRITEVLRSATKFANHMVVFDNYYHAGKRWLRAAFAFLHISERMLASCCLFVKVN